MSLRSQDDYNPLRPYHFAQAAEVPATPIKQNATRTSSGGATGRSASSRASNIGTSARDMLSDMDYSDYLNDASPSLAELFRNLFDQGVWKYSSILLAQPFDVAKTILQVQLASAVEEQASKPKKMQPPVRRGSRQQMYDLESDDSGDDSTSYFTSATPLSPRTPTARRMQRPLLSRSPSPDELPATPSHKGRRGSRNIPSPHTIALTSTSSLTAAISYLWQTEGAWGVWKGTNSSFIHNILLSSSTTFFRSLLCALFAIPDPSSPITSNIPGGLDILSSPSPFLSLIAATAASAIAAVVLAPIDIARTRLILTPCTHPPRQLLPALRSIGAWTMPSSLAPATILHGSLPTLISASTPLFCRARLGIDPILTPTAYAVATFASQAFELAVKLPIETVLRRGQLAFANEQEAKAFKTAKRLHSADGPARPELETVVPVGSYRGLVGTMYTITFEEGERASKADQAREGLARATGKSETVKPQQLAAIPRRKKGQGVEGLYRGWRVGAWGLLGVWGAAMLGGGKGGEF